MSTVPLQPCSTTNSINKKTYKHLGYLSYRNQEENTKLYNLMATMSSKYTPFIFVRNLTFFMLFVVSSSVFCWTHQEEHELREQLFQTYDKTLRPVKDMREAVHIEGELKIFSAREFDIVRGYITVQAYLGLTWCDEFLYWNTSLYNITNISVHEETVWHPGIIVYNTESQTNIKTLPQLFLNNDGCLTKFVPLNFKSSCEVNAHGFPFDKHICESYLAFPDYSKTMVLLKSMNCTLIHEQRYENNWRIKESFLIDDYYYSGGVIQLSLTRKIQAYSASNLLPPIIFLLLNMMVGQLPVESGEKVSFATTLFLANIVYLGDLNKKLPQEPINVPLMFWCHLLLTSLSGISVIACIIASKRFFKTNPQEPVTLNKIHPEDSKTVSGNNPENTKPEVEIPNMNGSLDRNFISKYFICRCNVEMLMFNVLLFASVIFGLVFVSLFSQSIVSRDD